MTDFLKNIKKIQVSNIIGIFIFLFLLIPSIIYKIVLKLKKKELWLISENGHMARDNGFAFYKFMKKNHPEIKTYFAIDKKCSDYEKVSKYGNVVDWEKFKHYFLYMSATKNISSHKEGEPNHPLFSFLHLKLKIYDNFIFLQHGVLYQDFAMFHSDRCLFKIFICGAKGEYDFVKEKFGYNGEVRYTGLARFDDLYNAKPDKKIIAYIPTWRRWLNTKEKFEESEYYQRILSFINSDKLERILEKNDKYLYFYPHIASQKYINLYTTKNKRVKILSTNDIEIQDIIKKASLLITDFSSIFTDVAYMNKPIIYYQYDKEDYTIKHVCADLNSSYFDFEKDGFGEITSNESELIDTIDVYIQSNFNLKDKYQNRINKFFSLHDNNNCERIYNEIKRG